jgi:hypothetical protein
MASFIPDRWYCLSGCSSFFTANTAMIGPVGTEVSSMTTIWLGNRMPDARTPPGRQRRRLKWPVS